MPDGPARVAVVGNGAIGRAVAHDLLEGGVRGCELAALFVRGPQDLVPESLAVGSLDELSARSPDVVVEAASHEAVRSYGEPLLRAGSDLVCVSVGALADDALRARLEDAAGAGGSRLIVPSGAVGGLDMLRAAARGGLDEVRVEQRKSPRAVLGEGEQEISEPRELFEGSAREAAERFPTTMNIVAAVALAGIGFERTRCRLVADPALAGARISVHARGRFGRLELSIDAAPSPNPRTSAVTAMSVAAVLEGLSDPVAILP
jgi:aspartate dehydrogenase